MAVHQVTHPSADALRAFALGKLNEPTAAVVMNHLDSCPDCCKQVAALSGDDFLARLRQTRGQNSTSTPAQTLIQLPNSPKSSPSQPAIANLPPELAANPQYEILRELGRGGMGVVYLAKNKLMDRLEVLKVVNKALLDHPGAVERFLREIRSAAKLSHTNVVGAHSALQMGEVLAFAMEYIEGQDLASLVKSQGPLPIVHACYYVQQAALGLQHAFEKGMVHRDIKPQNLILAREGKKHIVKVLDFGLAKATREKSDDTGLTGEGKMLGTPDYIAPEQTLDAAKADIRADIYSLGCTLYYLLSGHPPFSATSLGAILVAHQMHEARPLNLERPEVPEELAAIVRKMMAKSPAKRYQTPLEVVQALGTFVKQGATPKASPELSVGATEAKPAVKMVARVDPPPTPAAEAPKKQSKPADVWGSLTEGSTASTGSRKSEVIRRPRAATVRERRAQKKWLIGGGIGVGVLLLALLGMWAGGLFKAKTPEGRKDFTAPLLPEESDKTEQREAKVDASPLENPLPLSDMKKSDAQQVGSAEDDDKGFKPLFNGKDLNGWEGLTKYWSVKDGSLVGYTPEDPGHNTFLCSKKQYGDFELKFKARLKDGVGNSGVQIRSKLVDLEKFIVAGPQCDIGAGYWGSLYGERFGGMMKQSPPELVKKAVKPNDYNDLYIKCVGKHVTIKVNDETMVDGDFPTMPDEGILAWQLHAGFKSMEVTFKDIQFKELPSQRETVNAARSKEGWVQLFNGKDLSGWEKVGKGDWRAENDILRAEGNERPGYLATARDYDDFELALEYRLGPKGNTGVFLHAWKEGDPSGGQFLEIQLVDDQGYNTVGKNNGTASIFGVVAPTPTVQSVPNTWHKLHIRMKGRVLQVSFDSLQVIHVNLDDYPNFFQRFAGLKRTTGRIGLQHFGTPVEFRNIEIKELPASKSEIPPAAKPPTEERGFVQLFNGKDKTGWKTHSRQRGNWHVEKGVLIGSGPTASHLYSFRGNYKNFHLRVVARINDGGNSGVYFRAPFGPIRPPNNPMFPQGYEAQINATHGDPKKTGSLIGMVQVTAAPHKPNEWFTMDVITEGNHIVIKVNDIKTADYRDDKRLYTSGHIALQQHDAATVVEFSKIEIKELK